MAEESVQAGMSREELTARIVAKALEDAGFREALVSDPRAAIEQEMAVELPPDLEVEVLEEAPNHLYVVLPAVAEGMELDDDQLEKVAGGMFSYTSRIRGGISSQVARPARPARPAMPASWDPGE